MEDLIAFALIVTISLLAPEVMHRFRVSYIPLLIIAGFVIGPNGLQIIARYPGIEFLAELGLLFMVFLAGLEVYLARLKTWRLPVIYTFIFGYTCFFGGVAVGYIANLGLSASLLLGIIFMSSSVGEIISIVNMTPSLKDKFGEVVIPSVIVLDASSLIVLPIVLKMGGGKVNMARFLTLSFLFIALSIIILPKIGKFFMERRKRERETETRFVIALLAIMVAIGEIIDLPGIVVAFLTGILVGEVIRSERCLVKISAIGHGFLVPIFFIDVGLKMNPGPLLLSPQGLMLVLTIIAGLTTLKTVSGLIYGAITGIDSKEAFVIGVLMWPQLSATLAAVSIGYGAGIINDMVFSAIIILSMTTATITPIAVRILSRREKIIDYIEGHIVVLGAGRTGGYIVDVLLSTNTDFVVVENDLRRVDKLRKRLVNVIYGDAHDVVVLKEAHVDKAKLVVIALPESADVVDVAKKVRSLNPSAVIVARVHSHAEEEKLSGLVNHTIMPEKITGLEIVWRTYDLLGLKKWEHDSK
ncbi:MAG: hypothetical protein DRN20_02055 [Thermoplasmata archaeon]|nr:MAG: hypothetical protein DRN20_02055 [Thermoplasmata archaeon]